MVISIIGILVGLLLPAINAAREAGRRAKCQSNMRNVVLAILGYVNNKNVFPPVGRIRRGRDHPQQLDQCSAEPDPSQSVRRESVHAGSRRCVEPDGHPMYSWVVPILPYLDNQELFNQWTMFTRCRTRCVAISTRRTTSGGPGQQFQDLEHAHRRLVCPDDNTIQTGQGNLSYVVNGGFALYHAVSLGLGRLANRRRRRAVGRADAGPRRGRLARHGGRDPEAGRDVPGVDVRAGDPDARFPGTSARR